MGFMCDLCLHARKHGSWPTEVDGKPFRGTHCKGCHRSWTAAREAHCRECHQHFSVDSLADKHRHGDRCLSKQELLELRRKNGEPVMRLDGATWRYAGTLTRRSKAGAGVAKENHE